MRRAGIAGLGVLSLPLLWLLTSSQPAAEGRTGADRPGHAAEGREGDKTVVAAGETDGAAASAEAKGCDARCLLSQYAGFDGTTPLAKTLARLQLLGYESVDFVVLLAPDPKDSAFSESFDSYLSAAKVAIEAADYSSDRLFDPWNVERASPNGGGSKAAGPHPLYRHHPGALLFRREVQDETDATARHREILLLLVVGETPTWGIQQGAFADALDLIHDTCGAGLCPLADPKKPEFALRVLGPSSSGAAESLRIGFASWIAGKNGSGGFTPPWRVEMVSGSASSRNNQRILQTELGARLAPLSISFKATVNPDDALWHFASTYLGRLGAHPNQIALLVESNTDYGRDFKVEATKADDAGAKRDAVLNLPFPLHIAEARPRSRDHSPGTADSVMPPTTIRDLYLSRGSTGPRSLSIDGELTRSANERALTNILRTISSQDRRFVGILASDVLDMLFLAQQVRAWFPDVIVVVFTSDLLFLDDAVPFMNGVLVASTYPLADWTQQASFPFPGDRLRHMFANEYAHGVYNAMLSLLDDKRREDTTDPRDFADYSRPFSHPCRGERCDEISPPLWMSVVSQNAFWPLEASDGDPNDLYTQKMLPVDNKAGEKDRIAAWHLPPENSLGIFSVLFAVFAILAGVAYSRGLRIRHDANDQIYPPGQLLLRSAGFPHPKMHRLGRVSLFLTLAILGFVLLPFVCLEVWLAEIAGETLDRFVKIATLSLLGLGQVTTCGLLLMSAVRWLKEGEEPPADKREFVVPAIVALVAVALGVTLLFLSFGALGIGKFNPGDGAIRLVFLHYRERVLSGGQSFIALAAMLGSAYLVWICGHLRQVRIHQSAARLRKWKLLNSTATNLIFDELGICTPCEDAVTQAEKVNPSVAVLIVIVSFYLVVGVLMLPRVQFFERALPGGCVAWFFPGMYVLIVGFLFWGCYSFVKTWVALKRMLLVLVAHPIAPAFRRIPARLAEVFRHPWSEAIETVWRHHCIVLFNSKHALIAKQALSAASVASATTTAGPQPTATTKMPPWPPATGAEPTLDAFMEILDSQDRAIAETLYHHEPSQLSGIALKPEEFDKLETVSSVHLLRSAVLDDQQLWSRLWEEFLVLRLVAVIGYVRAQIYNVIGTVSIATVPILLVTTLYPFQGNRPFLLLVVALVAAVVATTLTVFTQMNRNPIMSMIEGRTPGAATWDRSYVMGLVLHGAIPLATLVSVKFPAAGRGLGALADLLVRMTNR